MLTAFAGGRLFGEQFGTGRPGVLALHGWGRTHRDWAGVLEGFDAIALDLPGFGSTPAPDRPWGLEDYAESVRPVLAQMSTPAVLIGHSFGGSVAVHLAARAGAGAVRAVVATGSPLVRRSTSARPPLAFRAARWLHAHRLFPTSKMESLRERRGSADYRAASGTMRDTLVKVVNEDVRALLPELTVPLHLIWGEDDADVPVATAVAAAELAPDSTLTRLPGIGHDTPREAAAQLRAALTELALPAGRGSGER